MSRLLRLGLIGAAVLALVPGPAAAEVTGPCTAAVNGVDVGRIDALSSPLELTVDDVLVLQGVDDTGTRTASVALQMAWFVAGEERVSSAEPQNGFQASIDLSGIAPYTVGLFRLHGETDNCTIDAWVRVTGKLPFATLTGIVGLGLLLAGLTGQVLAVLRRSRMGWAVAGLAGIGTGIGAALLGQQFGRLQLSNWSLLLAVLGAALLGVLVALLVARPTPGGTSDDAGARAAARTPAPPAGDTGVPAATAEPVRTAAPGSAEDPARPSAPETAEAAAPPPPDTATDAGPYWCYVMGPVELLDLHEPTRVIALLRPGTWYLAQRDAGEWVHVAADDGIEGWAPRGSVHRHG
jgi:hypothetical protein